MEGETNHADQIKAYKYLIKVCPAGEMQDVLQHLTTMAGSVDVLMQNEQILGALRTWYETHRQHIVLPDGKIVMVSAHGRLDENFQYYDSAKGVTFSFDPFKLEGTVVSEEPMQVATCQLRDDLVAEVQKYCDNTFKPGKVCFQVTQGADGEDHQIIELSCLNTKLEAFWSGEWQSVYTLQGGNLSGEIKIRCHYFEMGNIHFNLDKQFDSIQAKSLTSAQDIVAAIKKIEDKYQLQLDDMYTNMQENLMKRMRRAVPVTGQMFDWDKASNIIR